MNRVVIKAYAKLNLFLDITGVMENGYHSLYTVMHSIGLYDTLTLEATEGSGIMLETDRGDLSCGADNLVCKGISAALDQAGKAGQYAVYAKLNKNIPSGAGMGGGSADCAAAIIGVNKLLSLGLSSRQQLDAAKKCGADVPFCLIGGAALCEGVGDIMTPLAPLEENIVFAAVKPDSSISTPAAYKKFDENGRFFAGNSDEFMQAYHSGSAQRLGGALYNAFTDVCGLDEIADIKAKLIACGAYGAEMTGSGAAVFGIFGDVKKAQTAVDKSGCAFGGVYYPKKSGTEFV